MNWFLLRNFQKKDDRAMTAAMEKKATNGVEKKPTDEMEKKTMKAAIRKGGGAYDWVMLKSWEISVDENCPVPVFKETHLKYAEEVMIKVHAAALNPVGESERLPTWLLSDIRYII